MEYGRFADRLRLPTATDRRSSLAGLGAGIYAVTLLLVLAGALGVMSAEYGSLAVFVAIVVLLVGLASTDLALLPVLAFPATLVMIRTGPLSVSDLVLIAAVVPALLLYRRDEAKDLQPLIWAGIAYQAFLVPTLILNPYLGNYVEVHELFWWSAACGRLDGRRDKARVALVFTAGCVGIAIAALMRAFTRWHHRYIRPGIPSVPAQELHRQLLGLRFPDRLCPSGLAPVESERATSYGVARQESPRPTLGRRLSVRSGTS